MFDTSKPTKKLTKKEETIISGLGSYASHKKIPFGDWQANRMIAREHLKKTKKPFMDIRK